MDFSIPSTQTVHCLLRQPTIAFVCSFFRGKKELSSPCWLLNRRIPYQMPTTINQTSFRRIDQFILDCFEHGRALHDVKFTPHGRMIHLMHAHLKQCIGRWIIFHQRLGTTAVIMRPRFLPASMRLMQSGMCGSSSTSRLGVFELHANEGVVVFHKRNDGVDVHVGDGIGGFGWRVED